MAFNLLITKSAHFHMKHSFAVGCIIRCCKRSFSDGDSKKQNLYGTLGINSSATQSEIKKAYYDLTFKYHPDKNEGSIIAATKFREVTEAYEILGNYGLRKRYDKGMPMQLDSKNPSPRKCEELNVKYQKFFDSRSSQQNVNLRYEDMSEDLNAKRDLQNQKNSIEMESDRPQTSASAMQLLLTVFFCVLLFISTTM